MAINGCLTLAWLEEDDPSRGFFRVCPAAIISAAPEAYCHGGEYGEEGFLRVVPDKNEMSTFKLRMRTLGRLCLIDLRAHPRENDKIRQNKNYVLGSDRNPFMIYSDVIRESPADLACEVIESDHAVGAVTRMIYRRVGDSLTGPYRAEGDAWVESAECGKIPAAQCAPRMLELDDTRGGRVTLLIKQMDDVDKLRLNPISDFVIAREPQRIASAVPEAAPAANSGAQSAADDSASDELPYALKRLKEQMGLNPRRGRSLSEVVDEQWRIRKQDELGQGVPPMAGSAPVLSPAERAVEAIDAAWEFTGARAPLISGIMSNGELTRRLFEVYSPSNESAPTDARMVELEAERLRLITEMDGLRRRTREMKAEVLRELQRTGEADADALRNSIVLLEEQIDARKADLDELEQRGRALEDDVRNALEQPVTKRLAEMLAQSRLRELLAPRSEAVAEPVTAAEETTPCAPICDDVDAPVLLSPDALIDRLSLDLRAHGWQFCHNDVIHVLTVLALKRPLILSGFTGCDDERFGEVLSDSLGEAGPGECICLNVPGTAASTPQGRSLYSVLDYPDGEPLRADWLDAGFLMRDSSALCLPLESHEPPALDAASYDALLQGTLSDAAAARLQAIAARLDEFGAHMSHGAFVDCARYVAAAAHRMSGGETMALDYALASRVLPSVMLAASDALICALPDIFKGMVKCMRLMRAPLPVER